MMSLLDMEATVSWCDTGSSLSKSPIPHLSVLLDKIGRVSSTLGNFSFFLYKSGAKKVRSLEVAIFGGNRTRHLQKEKKIGLTPNLGKCQQPTRVTSLKVLFPFLWNISWSLIARLRRTNTLSLSPATSSLSSLSHSHTHTPTHTHSLSHNSSPACFYSSNPKQLHFPK